MDKLRRFNRDHLKFREWTRHSAVLLVGGLVHIFTGVGLLFVDVGDPREKSIYVAVHVAPIEVWAMGFVIVGGFAMLSSVWPKSSEKWGYIVLTGVDLGWGGVYFASIFFADVIIRENLALGALWCFVAFMWWTISGLVNPDDTQVVVVVDDGPR